MSYEVYFPELRRGYIGVDGTPFLSEKAAIDFAMTTDEWLELDYYFEVGQGHAPLGGGIPWALFDSRFDIEDRRSQN